MNRRTFLQMLGIAPAAVAVAKLSDVIPEVSADEIKVPDTVHQPDADCSVLHPADTIEVQEVRHWSITHIADEIVNVPPYGMPIKFTRYGKCHELVFATYCKEHIGQFGNHLRDADNVRLILPFENGTDGKVMLEGVITSVEVTASVDTLMTTDVVMRVNGDPIFIEA